MPRRKHETGYRGSHEEIRVMRHVVGFLLGGILGAAAATLIFLAFLSLPPEPSPTDHTGRALAILVLVVFFCGGIIGGRAFSADFWSDLLPSVITCYVVMGFLCLTANLDFEETAIMIGFASGGIFVSTSLSKLVGRRFPPKTETNEI